jgi:hypothetical protein
MLAQDLAGHVLGNLLVVLKLACIAGEESGSNSRILALPPRVTSSRIITG